MRLVVISPEDTEPRETAVLGGLFAAGLGRYHLRKPRWPAERIRALIESWPAAWRPRLVLHAHRDLAIALGLGGSHGGPGRGESGPAARAEDPGFASRSCHALDEVCAALGRFDAVFFGPVFPSLSKPGYGPMPDFPRATLTRLLTTRTAAERQTEVLALGGVTAARLPQCRELGFDGAAVAGAIWLAADPLAAWAELRRTLAEAAVRPAPFPGVPVMCLTQDGLATSHVEQAERLCAAGARWIQLRMKTALSAAWLAAARQVVSVCRAHGAVCIVNDSVDIALAAGADGVHVGKRDLDWREARRRIGSRALLGGTVNDAADADRALAVGCLDYVGVGPLRFTATKRNLAPVLGLEGVRGVLARLDGLPAWVIGGVTAGDLPALRAAGAAGAAVTSALYREGRIEENFSALQHAWPTEPAGALLS